MALRSLVLLTVLAVAGVGCGGDQEAAPGSDVAAHEGLCAAMSAAGDGETVEADRLFAGRSHDQLHDLAARVDDVDRRVAARLLEAKAAVETRLARAGAADPDALTRELARLAEATAAAIDAVGGDPPPPCR